MRHYSRLLIISFLCIFTLSYIGCTAKKNAANTALTGELSVINDAEEIIIDEEGALPQEDENPIDRAFEYARTVLNEEEINSVTFAWLYARLWYYEMKNQFDSISSINGNPFGIGAYIWDDYHDYANRQAEITRLARNQEDIPVNYLTALGGFLRSETLRIKDIVKAEGGNTEYLMQEKELSKKLTDTRYLPGIAMLSDLQDRLWGRYAAENEAMWDVDSPLLLIAEVPEKGIYLYNAEPFGILVNIKGQNELLVEASGVSPKGILPEVTVRDCDGDGEEELIIAHTGSIGLGITYILAEDLYVMEYDNQTGISGGYDIFGAENLSSDISPELSFQETSDSFSLQYCNQTISFPKSEGYETDEKDRYEIGIGDIVDYDLSSEPITVTIGIVIHSRNSGLLEVVPCTADVDYTGKGLYENFIIDNVKLGQPD